jgi:hypothetical protein
MRYVDAFQQLDVLFVKALASMMFTPNQILPPLNGETDMDVNLCLGIGHNMPLLWSLPRFGHR